MTIKIHHLRPAPGSHTPKTRVGRGDASKGKTAGRGTKGSKARVQVRASFEGGQMPIHMRLPKLKGFKNRFKVEYQVVNAGRLAELFPDGGTVGVDDLVEVGAVRKGAPVKVLGSGDLDGVSLTSPRTRSLIPLGRRSPPPAARSPSSHNPSAGGRALIVRPPAVTVAVCGSAPGVRFPQFRLRLARAQEDLCFPRSRPPSGRLTCARSCCSRWR